MRRNRVVTALELAGLLYATGGVVTAFVLPRALREAQVSALARPPRDEEASRWAAVGL